MSSRRALYKSVEMSMKHILDILRERLVERKDIQLAFMFGSHVSGHITDESDVDIAVLFRTIPDFITINQLRDDISNAIKKEIDIVVLNDSSPIIRMQVLKNGVIVINKDRSIYNDFFVKTIKEYDDLKRIRKEAEDNILRKRVHA